MRIGGGGGLVLGNRTGEKQDPKPTLRQSMYASVRSCAYSMCPEGVKDRVGMKPKHVARQANAKTSTSKRATTPPDMGCHRHFTYPCHGLRLVGNMFRHHTYPTLVEHMALGLKNSPKFCIADVPLAPLFRLWMCVCVSGLLPMASVSIGVMPPLTRCYMPWGGINRLVRVARTPSASATEILTRTRT